MDIGLSHSDSNKCNIYTTIFDFQRIPTLNKIVSAIKESVRPPPTQLFQ